jgi:hypothetical protein
MVMVILGIDITNDEWKNAKTLMSNFSEFVALLDKTTSEVGTIPLKRYQTLVALEKE